MHRLLFLKSRRKVITDGFCDQEAQPEVLPSSPSILSSSSLAGSFLSLRRFCCPVWVWSFPPSSPHTLSVWIPPYLSEVLEMHVLRENHDNRSRSPLELKSIYLCIFPLRERLVMRNWSLQPQRLKSPDPGEPMAWFQSESRSKCRRRPMSQLRDSQAERFFLIQVSYLIQILSYSAFYSLQTFNGLAEAHPHWGRWCAYSDHWIKC